MDGLLSCEICGQQDGMVTEEDLKTHMFLEHEDQGPTCPLCNLSELTIEELEHHMNTAHLDVLSPAAAAAKSTTHNEKSFTPLKGGNLKKRPKPKMAAVFPNPDGRSTNGRTENHNEKSQLETQEFELAEVNFKQDNASASTYPLQLRAPEYTDINSNHDGDKISSSNGHMHNESLEMASFGLNGSMLLVSDSEDDNITMPGSSTDSPSRKRPRSGTLNSTISDSSSMSNDGRHGETKKSPIKRLFETFTQKRLQRGRNGSGSSSPGIWTDSDELISDLTSQDNEGQKLEDSEGKPECPFCDLWGLEPEEMSQHIENEHGDLLSPNVASSNMKTENKAISKPTLLSLSQNAKNLNSIIVCQMCGLGNYDPDFIAAHINAEHPEMGTGNTKHAMPNGAEAMTGTSDSLCPICGLRGLSEEALTDHVEGHFVEETSQERACSEDDKLARELAEKEKELQQKREEEEFKKLQAQYGMDGSSGYQQQSETALERAVARGQISVADYHQQRGRLNQVVATGMDDGRSRTTGLIDKIVAFYTKNNHNVSYGRVCSDMDHFGSTPGDRGWGCGYRNAQMLLSGMVRDPTYKDVVFNGREAIPAIGKLQCLIEAAWEQGWDPQGREQLGGAVCNTKKWIGATEVVALMSYLKTKYVLIDFHRPTGPNGTHPKMFEWVREYFGQPGARLFNRGNQIKTNKMPLYLQHQGHSRTIIGYEVLKDNSICLLIFDPSTSQDDMQSFRHNEVSAPTMRPLRKSLAQMKSKQYQIVGVVGIYGNDREHRESKLIRSVRIP